MKQKIINVVTGLVIVACIVFGILSGLELSELQKRAMKIVCLIALISALYCFIVGEISRNNSQMDKLWSILPIIYAWTITVMGSFSPRLIIMSVLISIWGIRLTYNFSKKGAYKLKFWTGEEDYRWGILRKNKPFNNRVVWAIFDFGFISLYQNALVVAICFPMIAILGNSASVGVVDVIATILVLFFIAYETIADFQQNKFQNTKWALIKGGKKLEELDSPYNKGFNTTGLWRCSRHPNYLGEQMIWISLYLFVVGAGLAKYGIFNWSIVGSMMLVFLFMGSSSLSESISSKKYNEYALYQNKVFKYIPIIKYK